MLIYRNTNGEQEAVSERMIVRFSRKEDLSSENLKPITFIHLTNNEQLKSLDEIGFLLKQMTDKINMSNERNPIEEQSKTQTNEKPKQKTIGKKYKGYPPVY